MDSTETFIRRDKCSYFRCLSVLILFIITLMIVVYDSNDSLYFNKISSKFRYINRTYGNLTENNSKLFSDEVYEFLKFVEKNDIKIFVIDPIILFKLLSIEEKDLLIKRQLVDHSIVENTGNDNTKCICFGVFQNDVQRLEAKLKAKRIFNSQSIFEGIDGSQRHWNKTEISYVTTHIFYVKNNECIQISVIYNRNNFLWIGKLSPEISNKTLPQKDFHFGKHEAAFDRFELIKLAFKEAEFYVPDESAHFIGQIKSSKFIECNFESAKNFSTNNKNDLFGSADMNWKVEGAILALKRFTKKLLIPFYISSGTLLGWYRQCGAIPYTSDVDTATWAIYASEQMTQLFINNKVGLRMAYIYGLVENGYQYAFYSEENLRIDLFYTYKEGDNLTYTGHRPSKKIYFRYIYPYFTLCSAELLGLKVLVPCDPIKVVTTEYGDEWYKPKKSWNYMSSAFNIGPMKYWTDEEAKRAYKEL